MGLSEALFARLIEFEGQKEGIAVGGGHLAAGSRVDSTESRAQESASRLR